MVVGGMTEEESRRMEPQWTSNRKINKVMTIISKLLCFGILFGFCVNTEAMNNIDDVSRVNYGVNFKYKGELYVKSGYFMHTYAFELPEDEVFDERYNFVLGKTLNPKKSMVERMF